MTAAYTILKIYDDTDTADLVDGTNYKLLHRSFAPVIATRRRMNIAGRGPFADVLESLVINISGASKPAVLANLAKLRRLLDRAERMTAGDQLAPVLYQIQAQGSEAAEPAEAMVKGPMPGSSGVILPTSFNEDLVTNGIDGVTVQFIHRGLLVGAAESPIATDSADNPTIREITFASDAPLPSPVRIEIFGWADDDHLNIQSPSMLVIAAEAQDIYLIEAEGMTATNYTSVTDAPNHASGGSKLRFTAPDTDEYFSGGHTVDTGDFNTGTAEVGVFAMIKGHASKDFILKAQTASYAFSSYQETNPFLVTAGDYTTPTPVYLGGVTQRKGHSYVRLSVQALDATGSPTLEIDYIVLVALKSTTYTFQLGEMFLSSPFVPDDGPVNVNIVIDPAPLTELSPFVGYKEDVEDKEAEVSHKGDAAVYMPGPTIASLWMGARGNHWRDTTVGDDPTQLGMTVTRSLGYLTPE